MCQTAHRKHLSGIIENASSGDIFQLAKIQCGGKAPCRIPQVHFTETSVNEELPDSFAKFFHMHHPHMEDIICTYTIPFPQITMNELALAFTGISKTAVAGRSSICYRAMDRAMESQGEQILTFYNESLHQGYLPKELKHNNGIIIAKPDRNNYFDLSNFCPLIIEDMLTKLLENIMARHIQFLLEEQGTFPDNQYRGQVGCLCDDTTSTLMSIVQSAKKRLQVSMALSLDISNFYGCIQHKDVLRALQHFEMPEYIQVWVASFLWDRQVLSWFCPDKLPYIST